jgi:hypothetical protein
VRSPLTALIQKAQSFVDQINALPEDERNLVLDLLLPEPEQPEAPVKKTRKKRKSNGAALPASKKRGLPQGDAAPLLKDADSAGDDESGPLCSACGNTEHFQDHFKPSPHYHEFATTAKAKASAQK